MQFISLKHPLCFLIAGFLAVSCSRSFNPDIERGSTYEYLQGHPEVRLSAVGLLDEHNRGKIKVTSDVVFGSLVYKKKDDHFNAAITVEIQVRNPDHNDSVKTEQFAYKISKKDESITTRQDVFTLEREIEAGPGEYEIFITVLDHHSGKQTTRKSQSHIPHPARDARSLTAIQLLGKNNQYESAGWSTITTYDVDGTTDSLKFIFQVTNNKAGKPFTVDTKLSRFKADTSAARPLFFHNLSRGDIRSRGIDYDREEVLQTNRRTLTGEGRIEIEYVFPRQERGNYRFEVTAQTEEGDQLFKARDFGVKSPNYPSIGNTRELARPLVYLMGDKEYEKLMSIQDEDSLKNAIDRFWLKHIGNKSKARQVIRMYYERVEEANKQFSNFKEGWKTDPGMMYVLFGPPWYVDRSLDLMVWSYSYNRNDPEYSYRFRRSYQPSEYYPFNNYVLQRSQHYFSAHYQQVQLWLNGGILMRAI